MKGRHSASAHRNTAASTPCTLYTGQRYSPTGSSSALPTVVQMNDPTPKPMTARPDTAPLNSGNHFCSAEQVEM